MILRVIWLPLQCLPLPAMYQLSPWRSRVAIETYRNGGPAAAPCPPRGGPSNAAEEMFFSNSKLPAGLWVVVSKIFGMIQFDLCIFSNVWWKATKQWILNTTSVILLSKTHGFTVFVVQVLSSLTPSQGVLSWLSTMGCYARRGLFKPMDFLRSSIRAIQRITGCKDVCGQNWCEGDESCFSFWRMDFNCRGDHKTSWCVLRSILPWINDWSRI